MARFPVGNCRYCGLEFMSKQSLRNHEERVCPSRPKTENAVEQEEKEVKKAKRYAQAARTVSGACIWFREND